MTAINLGIFGQSIGSALSKDNALATFKRCFVNEGLTPNVTSFCIDGSAVLKEHAPALPTVDDNPTWPGSQRYWLERTAGGGWLDGPCLQGMIDAVEAAPATHKPITKAYLLIGESSTVWPVEMIDPELFELGYKQLAWRTKQTCWPAAPNSVSVFIQPVGRRIASAPVPGVQIIREKQIEADDESSMVFGCDIHDLPLWGDEPAYGKPGDSHPDTRGNSILGWRAAQRPLVSLGKFGATAPVCHDVTRLAENKIRLPISLSHAGNWLVKPACPAHFAIRFPCGAVHETGLDFDWYGNALDIEMDCEIPLGSRVCQPYGDLRTIDRDNLVRDKFGTPLQTLSLAIPGGCA